MSYYVTNENSVLNINNAHLKVSGNVMTDVMKLGAIEFAPSGSNVGGTVNFTNVTTGITTTSNLNVGGTLQLGTIELQPAYTLESTTASGNVTSNTIQFTNATTGFVTTANVEVGTANLFVDTSTSNVGIGTNTPLDTLHINGGTLFAGHIIPTTNATFDIGSAEKKVRDLYVDTNSLWVGDKTKIAFSGGKMKFKRRKVNQVPRMLVTLATSHSNQLSTESEVQSDAVTFAQTIDPSISTVSDLKLQHWRDYAKTFDETKAVSDIFADNDDDYEAVTASEAFMEVGSNIFTEHSLSIGKSTDPTVALDVVGTIKASTGFSGSGAGLTSLNASNISSGTIDAARIPTLNQNTTGQAGTIAGQANSATITASDAAGNSTIVRRTGSGYILSNYIHTTDNAVTSGVTAIMCKQGNDYHRSADAGSIRSFLGLANSATIEATTADTANKIAMRNNSGDIFARLFRSDYQNQSTCTGAMAFRTSTTDNYIRFCSDKSAIRTFLGLANSATVPSDTAHGSSTLVQRNSSGHIYVNTVYIGTSTSRGIRSVGGQYGTVQTTGGGAGNWEGYSIDGRWVLMSDDTSSDSHVGIYNDMENEWAMYCTRNAGVSLYHNGGEKCRTESTGLYMLGTPEMDGYIRHRGDTNCYMGYPSNDRWGVWTSGSERLRVNTGGGLRVYGTELAGYNYASGNRGYMKGGITTDPPSKDYGLYVAAFIRSSGHVSFSDRRIKSNIVDINDTYALDQLRGLQPKYYDYKDTKGRGTDSVIGFIAQEVKEVVPRAVDIRNGEIPNIYTFANITSNNTVTFTDFNTSNLESNATTLIAYDRGTQRKELEIAEIVDEHTIRFIDDISDLGCSFDENGNVITVTETITLTPEEYKEAGSPSDCTSNITGYSSGSNVVSVEEYELLAVKATYSPVVDFYTRVVTTYPGTEIFIWGQEVEDFHHLNKDYLWTIGTAALQEVDRQQQADKVRISELETQLASVLARLDALESA